MAVKKTYRINLRNYGSPPAVMVSQYDEGYAIAFEIFDGPLPVLASSLSGYTFKLKGRSRGIRHSWHTSLKERSQLRSMRWSVLRSIRQ